jgi:DNA mismatch endonuclease (patch repair protein)
VLTGSRRRADIVFSRRRVVVFVDGCFWHSCPRHASLPKANRDWWVDKLRANVERDRDSDRLLTEHGWLVTRVWEHEDPVLAADRIDSLLRSRDPACRESADCGTSSP